MCLDIPCQHVIVGCFVSVWLGQTPSSKIIRELKLEPLQRPSQLVLAMNERNNDRWCMLLLVQLVEDSMALATATELCHCDSILYKLCIMMYQTFISLCIVLRNLTHYLIGSRWMWHLPIIRFQFKLVQTIFIKSSSKFVWCFGLPPRSSFFRDG